MDANGGPADGQQYDFLAQLVNIPLWRMEDSADDLQEQFMQIPDNLAQDSAADEQYWCAIRFHGIVSC